MFKERTYRSRDGLTLFYRDYPGDPQKTPVLCLHGLTRNSRDFAKLAAHLAPGRRVLAPDQRGRGRSQYDPNWLNYHPGVYVDDMWTLLREAQVERVIVVGTSLGGLIAMLMAPIRPQAFVGVVLNDIGPELDPQGVARIQSYVGRLPAVASWEEAIAQAKTMFSAALPDFSDEQWREFVRNAFDEDENGAPRLAADPRIGDAVRAIPPPPGATRAMWLAFGALRSIPTLAIRGEHSDLLSPATLQRMQREAPTLVAVTVPNRGHAPQLDEPQCVAAIDAFLAKLP